MREAREVRLLAREGSIGLLLGSGDGRLLPALGDQGDLVLGKPLHELPLRSRMLLGARPRALGLGCSSRGAARMNLLPSSLQIALIDLHLLLFRLAHQLLQHVTFFGSVTWIPAKATNHDLRFVHWLVCGGLRLGCRRHRRHLQGPKWAPGLKNELNGHSKART